MKTKFMIAALALVASTGLSHAGCDFFEHNDRQGEKFALQGGECAVLSRDSAAGCEGLKVKVIDGWNDRISSVTLNHNSVAVLKEHDDGSGRVRVVEGKGGVKELQDFNDLASVALCR